MNQMASYHGIILDSAFEDPNYPYSFKIFAKRKSTTNPWILIGIEIKESELEKSISDIQLNMKSDKPYYSHLYNDEDLVVIFKNKVFKVKSHSSTWKPIIEYGQLLGIPKEQLDFWPNRVQDEIHYFKSEEFLN